MLPEWIFKIIVINEKVYRGNMYLKNFMSKNLSKLKREGKLSN